MIMIVYHYNGVWWSYRSVDWIWLWSCLTSIILLSCMSLMAMVKTIVNAAFKAEVWTFEVNAIGAETKAINIGLEAKAWPRTLRHWSYTSHLFGPAVAARLCDSCNCGCWWLSTPLIACVFCQLSEEPEPGNDSVITIALRTPDNKTHRRRFTVSDFVKVS